MSENFMVVGVGASAGGLNTFKQFFTALKEKSQLAVVVIQHLDPEHESYLPDIISKFTDLEVVQVNDGMKLEPGKLYLNPVKKLMTIKNGCFAVADMINLADKLTQIDIFFSSLAENFEEKAAVVILSGKGRDGSIGIETVKENGGLVLVQDPATAEYSDMPRSAINTGLVDFVLPVEQISNKLNSVVNSLNLTFNETPDELLLTTEILNLLHKNTGHDFNGYKESTVRRRIQRQIAINNFTSYQQYYQSLKDNVKQSEMLFKELLIGVTCFFRDTTAFQALEHQVVIPLLREKTDKTPIRIWVAGCSTGEETYSIALLFKKHIDLMKLECGLQIFATDINFRALETARKGLYSRDIEEHVPEDLLANYFEMQNDKYRVKKEIRDWIVFSSQSLIKDPPFSRIDLISCRNVLIYLGAEIQKKILAIFNYSLRSGGYLFLGSAENIGNYGNAFTSIDKNSKLYKNISHKLTTGFSSGFSRVKPSLQLFSEGKSSYSPNVLSQKDLVEKILLEQFVPSAVLVNESAEVVYSYGKNNAYLETPQGSANLNVLSMAKEGLKLPLTTAFKNAVETQYRQVIERTTFKDSGEIRQTRLSVIPAGSLGEKNYYLVVFENKTDESCFDDLKLDVNVQKDSYILRLEEELAITREYLFRANEELDASNEELKSANEELISANEELQSSNEELETSKEELQSMNEELLTVNTELDTKNSELLKSNYDLDNLFNNLEVGVLYLSHELNIIRFTQDLTKVINLIAGDIGRPVSHTVNNFSGYPSFIADLNGVLQNGHIAEKEIVLVNGETYWMRIIPYRTSNQDIEGLVVTFNNITTLKKTGLALKFSEQKYLETIELLPIGIFEMDLEGRLVFGNSSVLNYFGMTQTDLISGIYFQDVLSEKSRERGLDYIKQFIETGRNGQNDVFYVQNRNGRVFPVEIHSSQIKSVDGLVMGLRGVILDVTEKIKSEEEREKNNKLDSIGVLAGGIAHDFNNILTAILGNISLARYQISENEKVSNLLLESEKAAIRARNLTNQLITFAKGGNPILCKTNIQHFVQESADFVMRGSNCSIKFDLASNLWQVEVDKGQISQVIQNLVINAIQAMPSGGNVFLKAENCELALPNSLDLKAGGYVRISIKDEGQGIKPELLKKIFDPYFSTKPASTGLGLSICYSVIKKHNGAIKVASACNSGSEFTFYLPAVKSEKSIVKPNSADPAGQDQTRILYMDDELMLRTMAKDFFAMYGAQVDLAADGTEAVELYIDIMKQGKKYDFVILDLTVPGKMGGIDTLKELKKIDPEVKAVVASGYSNSVVLVDYQNYGFFNTLTKPFNHEEIVRVFKDLHSN